jgi:hypothetical protein
MPDIGLRKLEVAVGKLIERNLILPMAVNF